jgi:ferrochelatase
MSKTPVKNSTKKKKIAVVLFNLRGPDSKNAILPFLMNFFLDKNIIRVPIPFRCLIAWAIARKRTKREAGESYGEIGDKSPLLENSTTQAKALESYLKKTDSSAAYKTFVCMRYWHPMSAQIVREVRDFDADEVILMPLYPQFSTTTTWSSYEQWQKAVFTADDPRPTGMICCYPYEAGFIEASADMVSQTYKQALKDIAKIAKKEKKEMKPVRVLFSAHGLPEKIIKDGDPYQWQCEQSAGKIAARVKKQLGVKELDWQICYQSRVGPQKWIGPSTEDALERAAHDDVPVIILPHAFTQEHVETLVEIEIEYREIAEELGVPYFKRVPTVSNHPAFIEGMADMVLAKRKAMAKAKTKPVKASHLGDYYKNTNIAPDTGSRLCSKDYGDCCLEKNEIMVQTLKEKQHKQDKKAHKKAHKKAA